MTIDGFKQLIDKLRRNYGESHYTKEFANDLYREVKEVPDSFCIQEITNHMRHFKETRDRPKIHEFSKIQRDYLASVRFEKKKTGSERSIRPIQSTTNRLKQKRYSLNSTKAFLKKSKKI